MNEKEQTTVSREELRKAVENLKMSAKMQHEAFIDEAATIERIIYARNQYQKDKRELEKLLSNIGIRALTTNINNDCVLSDGKTIIQPFVVKLEYELI